MFSTIASGNAMLCSTRICSKIEMTLFFFDQKNAICVLAAHDPSVLTTRKNLCKQHECKHGTQQMQWTDTLCQLTACDFSHNVFYLTLEIFLQESGRDSDLPTLSELLKNSCPWTTGCKEQCVRITQNSAPCPISSLLLPSFLIIKSLCRELILWISPLPGFMISTVQSDRHRASVLPGPHL